MIITMSNMKMWRITNVGLTTFGGVLGGLIGYKLGMKDISLMVALGLFIGIILCQLNGSKFEYKAEVVIETNSIRLLTPTKIYTFKKGQVSEVELLPVWYGGKYLDLIGYKVCFKNNNKRYTFYSGKFKNQEEDAEQIKELYNKLQMLV